MLNLNIASDNTPSRIDSDRDVLPFPTGGVWGAQPGARSNSRTSREDSTLELARSIEQDLDALKFGLDRLTVQIDEDESRDVLSSLPFRQTDSSGPRFPAA